MSWINRYLLSEESVGSVHVLSCFIMELGDPDLCGICVLGQGTFGRVYLCKSRNENGKLLCVKRFNVSQPHVQIHMILEEIYIISQIKHPYIVEFERTFVHANTVNIVMEYLPGGTIRDVINKARIETLPLNRLIAYFCDILLGLEYLHIRHIIHRDLKPENLMLTLEHSVKIGDFGISAIYTDNEEIARSMGTPLYAAPEILRGEKGEFTCDIWSLGCVLYELCTGQHPFADATDILDLNAKVHARTQEKLDCQHIKDLFGAGWGVLCERMLIYEANKRILIPNILTFDALLTINFYHKYFDYKY